MFITGLKHGMSVLIVVAVAAAISTLTEDGEIVAFTIYATTIITSLGVGYLYKKYSGPLIWLSSNTSQSKNTNNFWGYIFGVGLIWGPAKLLISGFPISDASVLENFIIAVLAIPLSGMAVIGALIIGGLFFKGGCSDSHNTST